MFMVEEKPFLWRGCEVFMVEEKPYLCRKLEGVNGIREACVYGGREAWFM